MTRRRDLERHRHTLAEIRSVMHSLKILAYIESRKLTRLFEAQTAVVDGIEEVAHDFLAFHPSALPRAEPSSSILVLVGAERGFCGDINHALLAYLAARETPLGAPTSMVALGRRLHPLLEGDARVIARLDGPAVAGEVPGILERLVAELKSQQRAAGIVALSVMHHRSDGSIGTDELLPPFPGEHSPAHSYAPILNLSPREFLTELLDQYLFAALSAILYDSLLAEHRNRVAHLEGAVQRIDDELASTARRSNRLRQEELIEEIEVILLNAAPARPDLEP
jgi:F-type H+-transporting ATPase subunit gamma